VAELKQFKLPDVGEGLTEAEIVSWKVKPGDTIKVNEVIVEIETAKSLVELPSPFAGVVSDLLVPEGTTVDVGTPIISVDVGVPGGTVASAAEVAPAAEATGPVGDDVSQQIATPKDDEAVEPGLIGGPAPGGRTSILVGYGPRTTAAKRRPRKDAGATGAAGAAPRSVSAETAQQAVQTSMMTTPTPVVEPAVADTDPGASVDTVTSGTAGNGSSTGKVLAKPPVRKLAKDLGVDLATLTPTGPGGTVTRTDVEQAASGTTAPAAADGATAAPAWATAAAGERETRIPVKGVRKMTAQAMVNSAFTAPHVTEFVTVDVTRTMALVERLKADRELRDVKVSPLLLVAKALILAVRRNPEINASWDERAQEIVLKRYVNLGIAAATPRGLIVPNVKDADRMTLVELARALNQLTATAREGKTPPADMAGGTITITNVGVFGVDSGTPILNPGEAAILCFGAVRDMPWVHEGEIAIRKVTQLALSFDHRLVDGELGSRFLADLARVLEDPATALVW
jgi:2-oxoisovalerate dehydrogenase E2 component (dihydrolipoyl transacylase)